MTDAVNSLVETIRAAAEAGRGLRLRGGGTKDFYGQALHGAVLDTRGHAGIVAYEPTELVVTVRGGTRLTELEATLAEKGQMLPFEPPHFGADATIGGAVAAGLSGPRRQSAGALRDFVLGVRILDGRGQDLTFGGQVMKNVAGYDVSRLIAGSMGTLGLILEVSLKVLPIPVTEATLQLELPQDKAIEIMNRWGGKPLPVSATAWTDGDLWVRLSGAEAAVRAAREKIGGEVVDDAGAAAFWTALREHTEPFFRDAVPLWRVSVPSTTAALEVPGEQLIEWGGSLRWLTTGADARVIRELAARAGGHATLFRGGDKAETGVFHPLAPAVARIHANLKREFDPHGVLNRGRMYPEF
ncbi:MAG: glycolate oxidase subunit GlcE [Betaproteobacteria bacterium]|jgi:glycolate oxidase FAD binding subunit|nr:glycolate oxidase subunit GlcE [Betaproteobacteria bacterium]